MLQAQVMKGKPADARMEGVHRPSPSSIPVMFFGTLEIAWVSPSDLTGWREGIQAKLHTKPKGRKAFESSLQEVGTAEHNPAQPQLCADLATLQATKSWCNCKGPRKGRGMPFAGSLPSGLGFWLV